MIVKTEFASVEENDGSIRKAIERRAYALYERDGSKDGSDLEHWFQAEQELTIQDATCSIEDDELTIRLPMEGFPASTVLISISARKEADSYNANARIQRSTVEHHLAKAL